MIIALLKTAIQNLKKIQKQLLPFLKLIIETYADMILVENIVDQFGCKLELLVKLLKRCEIFISEIKKLLIEYKKQKLLNTDLQKKIIETNFHEFEIIEFYINSIFIMQNWFESVQSQIDNFYNDENVQQLDRLVEEIDNQ